MRAAFVAHCPKFKMAATRKKQDEKHLKILRELVSLATNKQCFDCHQRGPTYVNMTIGSYVCTTCSGMLRGLTPPHRVKSISMATFSQEELDLLKTRGNEYCRGIWLGLYDANSPNGTKDEQQIKDFMVAKYEKKRYYLDPSLAATVSPAKSPAPAVSRVDPKPFPLLQQPNTLNINTAQPSTASQNANMFTPDKDLGTADAFGSATQLNFPSNTAQASFANFDNNPIFNSFTRDSRTFGNVSSRSTNMNRWSMPTFPSAFNAVTAPSSQVTSTSVFQQQQQLQQKPAQEDRYAALKDLDSLMKTHEPAINAPTAQVANGFGMSAFGSPSQSSNVFLDTPLVNPFTGAPSTNSTNPWGSPHQNNVSATYTNPFQSAHSAAAATQDPSALGWSAVPPMNGLQAINGNGHAGLFSTSQSMNFPPKMVWPTANPFTLGASPAAGGHSNNPFL